MVKVEVVMDERTFLARAMLNLRLIKLSWALFFILIGVSWILENLKKINGDQMSALIYTEAADPAFIEPPEIYL